MSEPREADISSCDECPMDRMDDWLESICNHPDVEGDPRKHISGTPDWCPLRKGPVLVTLKLRSEDD